MKVLWSGWFLVFLSALFDSYAAFIVKKQYNQLGEIDYKTFKGFTEYMWVFVQSPILLTAVVTFVAAPALWFLALNRLELSVAYPVLVGLHLIFVLIAGMFFLGEPITMGKGVGTALIFASLFFFYYG